MLEILQILRAVVKFMQDNPELLDLIKRLFGRSATGPITLEVVVEEAQAVQALRATGGTLTTGGRP